MLLQLNKRGDKRQCNKETSQSILLPVPFSPSGERSATQELCPGSAAAFCLNAFFFFLSVSAFQFYVSETAVHPKGVLTKLSVCVSPCVCVCVCLHMSIHVCLCDLVRSVPI